MGSINFIHGGNIYGVKGGLGKKIIDFSANINPLGLPYYIKKSIKDNLDSILHYPDPQAGDLTKRIARYWNIDAGNVLVGNGSIELIYLIAAAFRPRTALIAQPDFSEYERAMATVKSRVRFIKLAEGNDFRLDFSQGEPSDIFIISNPHNPTGNIVISGRDKIERLPHKTIIIDEAFMDFVPGENDYTMIRKALKERKIAVLRTFTKIFALAGLRAGYLISHKDNIDILKAYQAPWSVNSLAQIAAAGLLCDKTYIERTRFFVKKERSFLFNALSGIKGLKTFNSEVNFILIKIDKKDVDSRSLREELLQKGLMIRDCSNFRNLNNKFVRIAVRKRDENAQLVKSLKAILKK